jgi:hypothetical protein
MDTRQRQKEETHLGDLEDSCADPGRNGGRRFVGLE